MKKMQELSKEQITELLKKSMAKSKRMSFDLLVESIVL